LLILLIFTCRAQASQPIEPASALSPHFNVTPAKAEAVNLSSSDTEEALELLSLSPARGPRSPILDLRSSSSSDLFEDWPKANHMTVSVYVVLTANASSYCASSVDAPHYTRESCTNGASTQQSCSQATSSQKPRRQKYVNTSAPRRKSKKTKIDAEHALAALTPRGGSVSTADFNKSELEIMYPLFVEEGLVDPSKRVNRKNA
jgi:hypothetical protein